MAVLTEPSLAPNDSFSFTMKRGAARIGNPKEVVEERSHSRDFVRCCFVVLPDERRWC